MRITEYKKIINFKVEKRDYITPIKSKHTNRTHYDWFMFKPPIFYGDMFYYLIGNYAISC